MAKLAAMYLFIKNDKRFLKPIFKNLLLINTFHFYLTATTLISTLAFSGNLDTCTVSRAG